MGNRLSKLTTRTGDAGQTGIAGDRRLAKQHPRITAIGEVDELNCFIGVMRTHSLPHNFDATLARIQQELFNLGGELAMPELSLVGLEHVAQLESDIDQYNASLPPLKDFVIPGGTPASAAAHVARAVCRRAERGLWACHEAETLRLTLPQYLNRLSDLLFVLSRLLSRGESSQETLWDRPRKPD